jgi:glycosyltransferase involved in cell wall biosynthesis
MHILLLTADLPYPPDSGPRVKTHHMLRYLSRAHQVTLVSFAADADGDGVETLRESGVATHTVHLRQLRNGSRAGARMGETPITDPHATRQMHSLLSDLTAQARRHNTPFDLVHADQIAMAPFATALPLPRLLDMHRLPWADLERQSASRSNPFAWLHQRDVTNLKRATAHTASPFDAITVVSEEDRRALADVLGEQAKINVIPIAVDPDRECAIPREPNAQAILSLTALWRTTNAEGVHWFARDVYPLVRRQAPTSRLTICGANPPPPITALAQADRSISVTGYIDDPRPFIQVAACQIVPLRSGGGMRVAILEALARGVPVVSTSIGCADLDLQPGEHLLVADTPSDFADAVGLLLRDTDLGLKLAEAGRNRILERYAWNVVCPAIDPIYHRMTQSADRRASGVFEPVCNQF